jgi:hypothetical protein
VISGRSSELAEVRADFFRFPFMAVPHANDAPCDSAGSPGKDDKAFIKPPNRDESRLAVVMARIWPCEVRANKDFLCTTHIEPAGEQRVLPLCPIARDAHVIIVATLNAGVNPTSEAVISVGQRLG